VKQHESKLIRQGIIRRGEGKGQIWTCCTHQDCGNGASPEGRLVSVDAVPYLARLAADQHLAEHQRADVAS
jgi:hypothetical protein